MTEEHAQRIAELEERLVTQRQETAAAWSQERERCGEALARARAEERERAASIAEKRLHRLEEVPPPESIFAERFNAGWASACEVISAAIRAEGKAND